MILKLGKRIIATLISTVPVKVATTDPIPLNLPLVPLCGFQQHVFPSLPSVAGTNLLIGQYACAYTVPEKLSKIIR